MTAFVIFCYVFAYFFLGGFVSGYLSHQYKISKEAFITCVLLWPFVLALSVVYKVTVFAALWSQAFAIRMAEQQERKPDSVTQMSREILFAQEERK